MSSTNSRPFNRPRNGLRWRRRSKTTLSLVIRPSRDSSEANPHPDHARARRRAEGKARLRFRLTCVTRIFQKSVFTKFAHGRWRAAGSMNVDRGRLTALRGPALCCGSPSPRILPVIALLFFQTRWRQQPKSAGLAHDPRLQQEAKTLKTRQEVDWAATASGAADKQGVTRGDGSRCFPIVIYNAGCSGSHAQLQPMVERESLTGGSAAE